MSQPALPASRRGVWRPLLGVLLSHLLAYRVAPAAAQEESPRRVLGITDLEAQLPADRMPTGRGIVIGHVEGAIKGGYLPHVGQARFRGVKFEPASGPGGVSPHAHATAKVLYGPEGLAPGVTRVRCYSSENWVGGGYLQTGAGIGPRTDDCQIITHSWIAEHEARAAEGVLRRLDWVADQANVLIIAAVDNGPQSPVPTLLASAFNGLTVGRADGRSSGGYTRGLSSGRCKPDVVAPGSQTSFAAPAAAAVAARLLEAARARGEGHPAQRNLVLKAALLAGASKPDTWRASEAHPLDEHLGAGVLRLDESYAIIQRGPIAPGQIPADARWHGFAWRNAGARQPERWLLELTHPAPQVCLALTWHRRIDGRTGMVMPARQRVWLDTPRLADFDLELLNDQGLVVATSASKVDNVEHLFLRDLPAGRYEVQVTRGDTLDEDWEFALAWAVR